MKLKTTLAAIPLMLGLGFGATQAYAAACTVPTGGFNSGAQDEDVDLTVGGITYVGEQCFAVYTADSTPAEPNGAAEEEALLEANYGAFDLFLSASPDPDTGSLGTLDLTLSFTTGDTSGTWEVLVEGIDPGDTISLDIGLLFKQATGSGTWFLDDVVFTDTDNDGVGTYVITWCGGGGQGELQTCETGDLSHLTAGFRAGDIPTEENPEPASLLLLGIGLAGLALTQRRRRRI